ncbi:patatin-domain-containing protein [Gigaspora margarita]|uniref:Patatin-domain-containing protein n=1 Tax=Gigaspora margarita TaxID=4874 RepID=A0A8H4A9F9_GIGMA|nr:patatin-domain-containing protein [Gigaspora margarita]
MTVDSDKISSLTGLPVWFTASPGFTAINETVGLTEYIAAFLIGALSAYCVYIKLRNKSSISSNLTTRSPVEISPAGSQEPAEEIVWTKLLFNTIVTGYIIVTFITFITAAIFGVGKLWSAIGIYHNVLELCLVASLLQKGTFNYIIGLIVIVVYSTSAVAITSQLDWYWDATFFKFQGVILDFLLAALFIRVAIPTHNRRRSESQPLLGGNFMSTSSLAPRYQLICLVVAATAHLLGNLSNVIGNTQTIPFIIFNLSYFISFPLYAFYVHQAEKTRIKYVIPDTSFFKFILLVLWATSASAIAILLSFYHN